jgi:phytanoyl-CoA hydroxylase
MTSATESKPIVFDESKVHWTQPMPEKLNQLTREQLQFYRDNGFVLVKGLFTKTESAAYRQECHALAERLARHKNIDATWDAARDVVAAAKKTVVQHCHDVQFYSAAFSRMIVDDRFTGAAADILGTPNVQLHHTKMFIKPPERGSPFPMHQDIPYFPHDHHSMIAAIIHFDDAPIEKGCVRVYPGSHKLGPLPHEAGGGHHLDWKKWSIDNATPCPAEAGDVLFFSYLTIHGSSLNVSKEARTTVLVQLRDPEDPPTEQVHLSRGQGMMLRGIDPTAAKE